MAGVRLEHVRKIYHGRHGREVVAVDDLSIDIRDGEFIALLGPSGCGKTSTLRMIAGLESITAGSIYLGDRRINNIDASKRDVAMAFESYALYPPLTVRDNLSFPLRARHVPEQEIATRVSRVCEILQLAPLLNLKPGQLSGGEQQRVSLGRALVREPALFLLDEPLSHLDPQQRFHARSQLKELIKSLNTTTIYVTHDQLDAVALADRIAVMNNGTLQQFASPQDLVDHPVNVFVAGFVGEPPINFIDCDVREDEGEHLLLSPSGNLRIPLGPRAWAQVQHARQGRVRVGIRPFDIRLNDPGQDGNLVDIQGARIAISEWLGDESHVMVDVDGTQMIAVAPPSFTMEQGAPVQLSIHPEYVHLFDGESGRLLAEVA